MSIKPDELQQLYETNECQETPLSKECNQFQLRKEYLERKELAENPEENDFLYPNLNDPNFIVKIAEKKEFQDTKYDGTIYDIKERSELLANAEFELSPHQAFVRNFLSSQTPYNSLLLFHGLGSGKTCSAIGVCEEQRDYLKSMGISKRIIIVASPNVQDNFRLQLFDERKLKQGPGGIWTMRGCVGNKLLKEVNPMNMSGISKEKIVSQIKSLINNAYLFLGYVEFSNYIAKTENIELYREKHGTTRANFEERDKKKKERLFEKNLQNEFNNRLIVIDEIHNIRDSEDGENKVVASQLMNLVKKAEHIRLLLLSATPMYNSYKEIIWLLNLMNLNDRRATIEARDIFDKNGKFKMNIKGEEVGKELLIRKATGYVSFVRGDNPYTFPFRIYPSIFSKQNTFQDLVYPDYQMNGKLIEKNEGFERYVKMVQTFMIEIGVYQSLGYKYIIESLRSREMAITTKEGQVRQMPSFENMDSFGYHLLRQPLEALIIVYPMEQLEQRPRNSREQEREREREREGEREEEDELYINSNDITGKRGLKRIMNYVDTVTPPIMGDFEYKQSMLEKYGRIFSPDEIGKYSSKIKTVCDCIIKSEGVILIYSEYIPGGIIPMALALEELGFRRYGQKSKNLFKEPAAELLDVVTLKPRVSKSDKNFKPSTYIMITGNPRLSPDNDADIKAATNIDNKDGHKIKVILISRAGSEGVDFKFIRQVHILEPWYNMNRIEQIIGRAVRNFSHKDLPFEKRNVQLFMYGTLLEENREEAADMYVYRAANYKAIQIGQVTRVLKETAVDCLINHDQTNFSQSTMGETVEQILSSGLVLPAFVVGDAPYSANCDYMESCDFKCYPDKKIDISKEDTYTESFIMMNSDRILQKIRGLMKERFFYKKNELFRLVNIPKPYPLVQIYAALTQLVEDSSEFITDKYGRTGYLINIDEYYLFQPSELNNRQISIFDRSVPIDFKHDSIHIDIKKMEEKPFEERMLEESKEEDQKIAGITIIQELKREFETTVQYARTGEKITRGDEDWYKHCGITMRKMIKEGFNETILLDCLIDHITDMIPFEEKLELYQYYYRFSANEYTENTFEFMLHEIFKKNIIKTSRFSAIIMYSSSKRHIMIWDKNLKIWVNAQPEDEIEVGKEISKKYGITADKFAHIIGFIGFEHKNRYLVFKVKDMKSLRNKGARCDDSVKSKKILVLNEIVGEEKYNKENTQGAVQEQLCSLQELLLRYYNKDKKDDKIWFLNFEVSMLYKF
uniref:Helicase ATP-binding domain-containing protein n=1 Tax=viral metagenome TaxID=1070528 RepID=A0A6C0BA17_9ZZZZ